MKSPTCFGADGLRKKPAMIGQKLTGAHLLNHMLFEAMEYGKSRPKEKLRADDESEDCSISNGARELI